MADITPTEWQEHVDNDRQQSNDIKSIMLVLHGNPERPETVRSSLVYTLQRVNAFIDVWKWVGAVMVAAAITMPIWLPPLKALIHVLAN